MMPSVVLATVQVGNYVNPWKALAILVVLLVWTRLLTWIDKDTIVARLPREIINLAMLGALIAGYILFFFLPGFGLAFGVLMLLFVGDLGTYVGLRAYSVGLGDLTEQFAQWRAGMFKKKGAAAVKMVAGRVTIMDKNGAAEPIPESDSPDALRYESAQQVLTMALSKGAQRIDLIAGEPAAVSYTVDGVKYESESLDRNRSGAAVQFLKRVAGLDMNERRKPQTGLFRTNLDNKRGFMQITTFGSTAGESMRLIADPQDRHNFKLENLGFHESQLKTLTATIQEGGGVVLLAAPKGQGLTSLAYAVIRAHDAFVYHIHTVERAPEMDLEGITQNALPANVAPAEEAKQVSWVVSQEPDVIMITLLEDPRSAAELAKFAVENHRVYVCLHANNTFDALRQWRRLVGDDVLAMKNLRMVVAGRLVRRLCAACKTGYTPDPTQLRKLNMNPEAVGKLYLARKEPMRDAKGHPVPCNFCYDLAFKGRVGIYEIFIIDAEVRKIVEEGGSDNQLKQSFRKQRSLLLQEAALAYVQAGETSVEEVLRVLKDAQAATASRPGAPAAGKGRPSGPAPGGQPPPARRATR
jgi:type II secretory ATPase GspE/PulE/Tfp pilus assembly ATPase PilB-like protein